MEIPSPEPREPENQIEVFDDCVETGVLSAADEEQNEPEPEPKVDWELQKVLREQECKGDAFPSSAQKQAVLAAGSRAENLATQLTEFYFIHNPGYVSKVPEIVKQYNGREVLLNRALMDRYNCDLSTFRNVAPVQTPEDLEPVAASMSEQMVGFGEQAGTTKIALANSIEESKPQVCVLKISMHLCLIFINIDLRRKPKLLRHTTTSSLLQSRFLWKWELRCLWKK